ncbi:MAG: hypothetical protein RI894_1124 [Bacteroidota bacterium]
MNLIAEGINKGVVSFDDDEKVITYYTSEPKKQNYTKPEEKVRAIAFCSLVMEYGYPVSHIIVEHTLTQGSISKRADMIVYSDAEKTKPFIIVECKKEDASEAEFKQAVNQAFSYGYFSAGTTKYIWVTKGNKNEYYHFDKDTNKQEDEADIPHFGFDETPPFKFVKGGMLIPKTNVLGVSEPKPTYTTKKDTVFSDLETITESDLIRIFKQSHDALWAGGELNPSQAFDELDKLIFCKIWDEKNTFKGEPYKFQVYKNETPNDLKRRIEELYNKGKEKDPEVFNKPIDLTAERFLTIVRYLQKINLTDTDLDSKGKAFETFLGTYFRGEFGQYFTPRGVVKMMIDALPMTAESRVLDTSCGSGGFLLYALDKVRAQADQRYDKNDPKEAVQHFTHWHDFAEKRLFGIEINESIARVAKMNMIIHDDGHTNVVAFDGLHPIYHIREQTKNQGFAPDSFDFIVTNPPFGSIVKQSEKAYMQVDSATNRTYYGFALKEVNWIDAAAKGKHLVTGRENQSTEVLFIEQCHNFLKVGGYLAVVIPDGILTNSSMQYVRDSIARKFRIVSIISLPQTTFTHTGAGVKSSVLVLKKHTEKETAKMLNTQTDLKAKIAAEKDLEKQYKALETTRREALKPLLKIKTGESQAKRETINATFAEACDKLKEDVAEAYQTQITAAQTNYPILMAIAEYIGYDAIGKTILQNDLPEITVALTHFIHRIESGDRKANFC